MKLQIQKDIVKTYGLIDGQKISGKLLKQIATEKSLSIEEVITLL